MTAIDRTEALKEALRGIKSLISSIESECDEGDIDDLMCSLENAQKEAEAAIRALAERTRREIAREELEDEWEYREIVGL